MSAKKPAINSGELNTEMLALVSAIIKYIDEADLQVGYVEKPSVHTNPL